MKQTKKHKTWIIILTLVIIGFLIVSKTNSIENIPYEEPEAIENLNKAISSSKFDIDYGISELNSLSNLPDYTEYKKITS